MTPTPRARSTLAFLLNHNRLLKLLVRYTIEEDGLTAAPSQPSPP